MPSQAESTTPPAGEAGSPSEVFNTFLRLGVTSFGGPIAHGFLTLSLLPKLRARSDFAIVGAGNAVNYGANKLRFLAPVPAGAKLHARSRLMSVEARPKGTLVSQEIQVGIVGQETPALLYEMVVLYNPPRK